MILESDPPPDARMVFFDINPNQLAWARTLLENAARFDDLDSLVAAFASRHHGVAVRPVAPHEAANAEKQKTWYRRHHREIGRLLDHQPTYMAVDLLTDPGPLFRRLEPHTATFFRYLDLFMVWHIQNATPPWIADLAEMAVALESKVRAIVQRDVVFCPGPRSRRLQLHAGLSHPPEGMP